MIDRSLNMTEPTNRLRGFMQKTSGLWYQILETKLILYTPDHLANVMNTQIGLDYDFTDLIAKTRACWSKQAEWWTWSVHRCISFSFSICVSVVDMNSDEVVGGGIWTSTSLHFSLRSVGYRAGHPILIFLNHVISVGAPFIEVWGLGPGHSKMESAPPIRA
jgi:hypothetical protein